MRERDFDLILFGATGFTGRLVAEYLLEQYGSSGELRWALAGRNIDRLEAVRSELQPTTDKPLVLLQTDSHEAQALAGLAHRSRVICSTVGPYALHGTPLVETCVAAGTHYCDLTGEVPWIARNVRALQGAAEESGARIVHSCGFDSIPSDIGNWFLQSQMLEKHGVAAQRVRCRVGKTRGGASGGTVASLLGVLEEAAADPDVRKRLRDKYWLYPEGEAPGPDVSDQLRQRYDPVFAQWTSPFVMALINERVVRRSNALLGFPWGKDFNYDEAQLCGSVLSAMAVSGALAGGMLTAALPPGRRLMGALLPKPGQGPSRQQRENGCFELLMHGEHPTQSDQGLRVRVSAERDPGYGATARMLGEAAVCLARDDLQVAGGIWTPASALAPALLPRLQDRAGISFTLLDKQDW